MQTAKFLSLFSGGELIPTHSFLPHPLPTLPLLLSPASRRPVGLPAGQRTLNLKAAWRVHSLSPHIPSYFSHIQPHDFNLNHLSSRWFLLFLLEGNWYFPARWPRSSTSRTSRRRSPCRRWRPSMIQFGPPRRKVALTQNSTEPRGRPLPTSSSCLRNIWSWRRSKRCLSTIRSELFSL